MTMVTDFPLLLPRKEDTLYLPAHPKLLHPLHEKLQLLVCHLSGSSLQAEAFRLGLLIIVQSWRTSTQKHYQTYHQRWQELSHSRGLNPFSASIENGLEFLYHQYENGLSHSRINTARSALSTVIFLPDGGSFGNHPFVSHLLKGVYESRASLPHYKDYGMFLLFYVISKCCLHLGNQTLKTSHTKLLLVALLSGQHCRTVHALTINGMRITNDTVHFEIAKLMKTSKPGKHQGHLELKSYPLDRCLCVVTCLRQCVKLTEPI